MRYWKWMKFLLMSKRGKGLRVLNYFVLASVVFSFITSCKKGDPLGANVLPASDLLSGYFSDTSTVISSIKLKDSIVSDNAALNLIGSYNDPVFGMTKASLYTQVILPSNTTFLGFGGTNPTLDSIVLVLPYAINGANYYGTLTPQTFTVDTIVAVNGVGLVNSKAYYSDTNVSHGSNHLAVITTTPAPADSARINYSLFGSGINGTYYPQLRLKLSKAFGQYLMDQIDGNSYYGQSSGTFASLLKGFYITVSNPLQLPGQGAILSIDPFLSGAGLEFFYKTTVGLAIDTTYVVFQIGAGAVTFGHFDHDYASTSFYVPGKDSIIAPSKLYVQAMAGVKTQLSFPYLKNWNKKNPVLINKAELDIPVNTTATGIDIPPSQLYVVRDSAGHQFSIPDEFVSPQYYGGGYDGVNNQYSFNITRYVQQILEGKIANSGLYLISGSAIAANGVVLYGPMQPPNTPRLRLRIFYTPLSH
jgi:hypothetical protein